MKVLVCFIVASMFHTLNYEGPGMFHCCKHVELDVSKLVLGPLAYTTISMCTHPCWSMILRAAKAVLALI